MTTTHTEGRFSEPANAGERITKGVDVNALVVLADRVCAVDALMRVRGE